MPKQNISGKKIVMVIAFRDFRDEEYFVPKEIFEEVGAEIKTVSTQTGQAVGADGGVVEIDLTIQDLRISDFDALVFIGGPGAIKYLDNDKSYEIAREAVKEEKILAAICISPIILAKAGVLKGKRATVWSSPLDKWPIDILKENGVVYEKKPVVIDGKIVTGNGPSAAKNFAKAIIESLK